MFAKIQYFETGRFEKNYTDVKQIEITAKALWNPAYQDCPKFVDTLDDGDEETKTLFYTDYCAMDTDGKEVYITEYKRKLSRKITTEEYKRNQNGCLENCGKEIMSTIGRVLKRYPFEKDCDYWLELSANGSDDDMPLMILYVLQKTKQVRKNAYAERHSLPYMVKRRLFVEAMQMAYTLLRYQLFRELIMTHTFFLKFNSDKSIDDGISCVMSISALFDTILKYFFNCDDKYKNIELRSRKGMKWQTLEQPFCVVLHRIMRRLFEGEKGWKDIGDLPEEMYMIFLRLKSEKIVFRENNFKNLMREMQYPYDKSRIECFEKLGLLGTGSFGDVHLARHKGSGAKYAIKVIKNYKLSQETAKKFFETLMHAKMFDHNNIVKYFDAWTSNDHANWISNNTVDDTNSMTSSKIEGDNCGTYYTAATHLQTSSERNDSWTNSWKSEDRYTFIVLQACSSSLHSLMQNENLLEGQCIRYMKEFIKGLAYLNNSGFMHRDVKPQNALISEKGNLLIADLDTVKRIKQKNHDELTRHTLIRTPAYVSPEMSTKNYDERTDYYSIGITFAQMICPELCGDMKSFLATIHKDCLGFSPNILHPRYVIMIRWLTEADPTDRMGFFSFSSVLSLLETLRYTTWSQQCSNSYSVMIKHDKTGEVLQCLRVIDSKNTIREVIKRYSRPPGDKRKGHPIKYRLSVESASVFEKHYQLASGGHQQEHIELKEDKLVPIASMADYVYICYSVILSKEKKLSSDKVVDNLAHMLEEFMKVLTRWGSFCLASFSRCQFCKDCFIIEPFMMDAVPVESVPAYLAQFWPPEKISGCVAMTEAGCIFSIGIYLLWNLLLALEVSEEDRFSTIKQLQDGKRPDLLSLLAPYVSQTILWFCAYHPQDRASINNIPPYIMRMDRTPTVDTRFPFRLTFENIWSTEEDQSDGNRITRETSKLSIKKDWKLLISRRQDKCIYTVSNSPAVMEKVMNRLKICGHFRTLPRQLVKIEYKCDAPLLLAECMLDTNENGFLVAVPRTLDAVDWFISEHATQYSDLQEMFSNKKFILPYIHTAFISALRGLFEFHRQGLYHGNINLNTFLVGKYGSYCLTNPMIVEFDNISFNRTKYITEYTSPEQKISLQGSPASDVFSLGVTLFAILCHYHNLVDFNLNQFQNDQELQFPEVVETEYCDLIRRMTRLHPKARIDCGESLATFNETCSHYLEEKKESERQLFLENKYKTDYR